MNARLDPLKRITRELVDKKLWPVAVALVAALVAIPMLLGAGSATDGAAAPVPVAATAPGAPESKSLVTVIDEAGNGKDTRPGRLSDPFYDPPAPPAPDSASAPAASPASSATTAPASSASPAGAAPAVDPRPREAAPPEPATADATSGYFRTVVRWYVSERNKAKPIRRLTPLGGAKAPAALYLGVTKSEGTYAVFLLAPGATSEGDAKCEDEPCRVIGLKKGQSQVVTVAASDGREPRRYHLDVVSVKPVLTDAGTAATMRARVHADGRDVMREMWQDEATAHALRPIRYEERIGLLFKPAATAAAAKKAAE